MVKICNFTVTRLGGYEHDWRNEFRRLDSLDLPCECKLKLPMYHSSSPSTLKISGPHSQMHFRGILAVPCSSCHNLSMPMSYSRLNIPCQCPNEQQGLLPLSRIAWLPTLTHCWECRHIMKLKVSSFRFPMLIKGRPVIVLYRILLHVIGTACLSKLVPEIFVRINLQKGAPSRGGRFWTFEWRWYLAGFIDNSDAMPRSLFSSIRSLLKMKCLVITISHPLSATTTKAPSNNS
jgi:hypothetical protein